MFLFVAVVSHRGLDNPYLPSVVSVIIRGGSVNQSADFETRPGNQVLISDVMVPETGTASSAIQCLIRYEESTLLLIIHASGKRHGQ